MFMHTPYGIHLMHTYSSMYARVYTCTYCGRKGHLARFHFDRLNSSNFANENIWVPNVINPYGPKNIWVPKSPSLIFNVGVGSHKT